MGVASFLEDIKTRFEESLYMLSAADDLTFDYGVLLEPTKNFRETFRPQVDRLDREQRRLATVRKQIVASLTEALTSLDTYLDYATHPDIELAAEVVTQKEKIARLEQQLKAERQERIDAQFRLNLTAEQLNAAEINLREQTRLREKAETSLASLKQEKADRGMFEHAAFRKSLDDMSWAKPDDLPLNRSRGKKRR